MKIGKIDSVSSRTRGRLPSVTPVPMEGATVQRSSSRSEACRCGHPKHDHQGSEGLGGAQCRICPGDDERSWRHPFTPDEEN